MIMNCAEDFHVTGENEERVGKGLAALANGARKWPEVVKGDIGRARAKQRGTMRPGRA
jgi:hypothetical protein